MDRRKFLTVLGGGIIVAAGVGAGGFVITRTPKKALAPWFNAGSIYNEARKKALSYAILAPNPHNRQPWLVDLSKENKIILFVDRDKLLPHTDPFNRQITIGLGCFLEILRMAAAQDGYLADIDYFPNGADQEKLDERPVAEISFSAMPNIRRDPLFSHIVNRRTLKTPYDTKRIVDDEILQDISLAVQAGSIVGVSNKTDDVLALRQLTSDAEKIELETDRTYKESVDLFRIGKKEVEANPDGIAFSGALFDVLSSTGMFTREAAFDRNSSLYGYAVDAVMENANSAMAYIWLVSKQNTRIEQLKAGVDYVRINLSATRAGVGIHPMSQALQEYKEMQNLYEQCKEMLDTNGGTVQMLARLGYASSVPPTPRWKVSKKIMRG